MNPDDEAFKEEFKPLHVPHEYDVTANWQDRVIFALADLNNGTIEEVAAKLQELDPGISAEDAKTHTEQVLPGLYDKGLLKAVDEGEHLRYNLSKILDPHSGKTDI
ncbi:MAG: hypothetical protein ABIN95_06130 [Mucilaginibacter sp.]